MRKIKGKSDQSIVSGKCDSPYKREKNLLKIGDQFWIIPKCKQKIIFMGHVEYINHSTYNS